VQVTWFAYISTSGLTSMTHRLTDTVLDPPGAEPFNTETLQRLPRSLWSYRPPHEARIEVSDAGHGERPVCFGSFNRYAKASETTLGLWIAALHAAPGSTLTMLTVPRGAAQRDLLERFEAAGIDRARVRLLPRLTQSEYYAAYREVDVCFDTTPYSGGFTVCDALWMGVPVVTLRGETSVSRSGSSILASAGFGEWIADGADAYVRIAAGLARQGRADGARRAAIRERFRASALMDEAGYTRDLERAYRAMWKAWCAARTAASLR
jgi:predicted O-linked N-acetylglucosamine transferase (SPINDLY family)